MEEMTKRRKQMTDVVDLLVFLLSVKDEKLFGILLLMAETGAEAGVPPQEIQRVLRKLPMLDKREGGRLQ